MRDAGALPATAPRPPALRTFDAARYGGLLAEIPSRVGPSKMQAGMDATEAQLRPLTVHPKVKALWRIADGLTLVAELDALARSVLAGIGPGGAPVRETAHRPARGRDAGCHPAGQPASVFANSVGKKRGNWYPALHQAGHAPAFWSRHPVTRRAVLDVSQDDRTEFHRRFLIPTTMQREFGLHRQTCPTRLRAVGVMPFSPGGADFGPVYLRREAEPDLRRAANGGAG